MADAGKVMFLGLRKQTIEKQLKEAKVIVEAFKIVEDHWLEVNTDLMDDFEDTARKYDVEVEKLEQSLKEAEEEWIEASKEYRKERYGEE